MKRWEYLHTRIVTNGIDELTDTRKALKEYGDDGWEVIGTWRDIGDISIVYTVTMKRRNPNDKAD